MHLTLETAGAWLVRDAVERVIEKHSKLWAVELEHIDDVLQTARIEVEYAEIERGGMRGLSDHLDSQRQSFVHVHGSPARFTQQQSDYLRQHRECPCWACQVRPTSGMQNLGMNVLTGLGATNVAR